MPFPMFSVGHEMVSGENSFELSKRQENHVIGPKENMLTHA